MLDGMLQRIEGRRQILSSDAVRDWRRHFRAREELPFAAVRHAYRAEAVDIFRAYHFGLAFAREHLGTAASLLNEPTEQRRCWKRDIAIFYDAPAPDVGGDSREGLVCRMNVKGDRAAVDVGQPIIGLAIYHRHRVRECRAVPTLRAFPASQAASIGFDATLHREVFRLLLPVKGRGCLGGLAHPKAAPVLDAPMPAMEGQISFNLEDAGATGSLDGIPGGNLGGRVEAASFLPQFVGSWASDAFTNDCTRVA